MPVSFARASWSIALSLLIAGCGSDTQATPESPLAKRAGFCAAWAKAACNKSVVEACTATDAAACIAAQTAECEALVPEEKYQATHAKACIDGVTAAYRDAKLTLAEVATVTALGAPCDEVVVGPGGEGATCSTSGDCDVLTGLRCVIKSGEATGACAVPDEQGGGQACSRPEQTCAPGYYCDVSLASPACLEGRQESETCSTAVPCGANLYCNAANSCSPQGAKGEACVASGECVSGICAVGATGGVCVEAVQLSPTDPACSKLR